MFSRIISILGIIIFLSSCAKEKIIYEPSKKVDPFLLYNEAYESFDKNDFFYASKKFSEAELNFQEPILAAKAAIMSSFSLYSINFYDEALESLNRFFINYPADKNVMYAHYLSAIIHFEQIEDEKHDLEPLINAQKKINFFLDKYPNSDYAIDLDFKKDLVINQFAAKELYIAKYYIEVQKWIPAINRLKLILEKYEKTVFVEEALHRLVEIHYHLGLEEEAKKYASLLGYNYNSSEWFKQSYKIINKDYKIPKISKTKKNKNILKKIIEKIKIKK
jgi:outer membrane protein assembly factor BamD